MLNRVLAKIFKRETSNGSKNELSVHEGSSWWNEPIVKPASDQSVRTEGSLMSSDEPVESTQSNSSAPKVIKQSPRLVREKGTGTEPASVEPVRDPSIRKLTTSWASPNGQTAKTNHLDNSPIALNFEQERLFKYIEKTSSNVFVSGRAGSGKSFLLRFISENSSKKCIVVAPTGVAALNAGGVTIHSAFKLPITFIDHVAVEKAVKRLKYEDIQLLRKIDLLIIDEISMVRADVFLGIDSVLRKVREVDIAFGGVQVAAFGDPYQLEPVVDEKSVYQFFDDVWGSPFFFSSPAWKTGRFAKIELLQSLRQHDGEFLSALDHIRTGEIRFGDLEIINDRVRTESDIPLLNTVRLSTRNETVDEFNQERLSEIRLKKFTYVGMREGDSKELSKRSPAPEILDLKTGAQVMMVANDTARRWVNGTMATVAELTESSVSVEIDGSIHEVQPNSWEQIKHRYSRVEASIEHDIVAKFTQYPIALGWARTIHKSQGQSYEACSMDLAAGIFANGQAYVGLSRCKRLDGLYLNQPLEQSDIRVSERVQKFMSDLTSADSLPEF